MDGYRFNRKDLQGTLTIFRNNLREGKVILNWNEPNNLRINVASVFGIKPQDFNAEYFDKRTIERFAALFAVPLGPNLDWRHPTLDEVATAVQNFINRRQEPWVFFKIKMMVNAVFPEAYVPLGPNLPNDEDELENTTIRGMQ